MKPERILPFNRWEITNGDFYLIMQKMAKQKEVKVDTVVKSPRFDGWLKRISYALIIAVPVLIAVGVLIHWGVK